MESIPPKLVWQRRGSSSTVGKDSRKYVRKHVPRNMEKVGQQMENVGSKTFFCQMRI
jgi:hypothetical protein